MFDLPPPDPAIEFIVASRGMSQGTVQTKGVQLVSKVVVHIGDVQIGGQWKNLTSPAAEGVAMAFVSVTRRRGPLQLTLRAAYKIQTNVHRKTDSDGIELTGSFTRGFERFGIRGIVEYSPDDVGRTRQSFYFEGGPTFNISKSTKFSANIGRREQVGNPDYTSFNAGITTTPMKGFTIEARYYGTAQSEFGEAYRGRIILSVRHSF